MAELHINLSLIIISGFQLLQSYCFLLKENGIVFFYWVVKIYLYFRFIEFHREHAEGSFYQYINKHINDDFQVNILHYIKKQCVLILCREKTS